MKSSRQQSILEAALTAFSTKGFDQTSIEDICAAAPSSVGSFYHHFGSKEGVAATLFAEAVERFQTGLRSALHEPLGPRAMATILVSTHLTWVRDNEDWARYLFQMGAAPATAAAQPQAQELNRSLLLLVRQWASPHIENGAIVQLSATALLAQIFGPSYMVSRAWLAGGAAIDDMTIRQLAEAAARSIQPGGPPSASRLR